MVLGIQIAGFLFGLFLMYYSFLKYKRKEFSVKEFSFWFILWFMFIIVAVFPSVLDPVSKKLNFARTFDLLVITGFLFLLLAIFYTYSLAKKNQKQLENIVRELAVKRKGK